VAPGGQENGGKQERDLDGQSLHRLTFGEVSNQKKHTASRAQGGCKMDDETKRPSEPRMFMHSHDVAKPSSDTLNQTDGRRRMTAD